MSSKAILFLGVLLAVMVLVPLEVSATEHSRTSGTSGDTYSRGQNQNTNMVPFEDVTKYAAGDGEKYLDGKTFWWWWHGGHKHGWYPKDDPKDGKGDDDDDDDDDDGDDGKGYAARKVGYFDEGNKIGVDGASPTKPLNSYTGGKKGNMVAFEDTIANKAPGEDGMYLDDKTWWFWLSFFKWWGHGLYATGQKGGYFDKMGENMDFEGTTATKPLN